MKIRFMGGGAATLLMASALCAQDRGMLTVTVISGDLAVNNIRHYVPTPTVIQVNDENGRLVSGATVTVTFPSRGPSGAFADGSRTWTAPADAQGLVTLPRFAPNLLTGSYQVLVNANAANRVGSALIHETNTISESSSEKRGMSSGSKILVVLGVGAAVAAGSLLALKGSSVGDHSALPPTGVTLGTISIGAPH